jgi:hypothetical protein
MRGRAVTDAIAAVLGILVILALALAFASTASAAGIPVAEIAAEGQDDARGDDEWIVVAVVAMTRRAAPPRVAARTVPVRHRSPGPPPVPPPER